MSAPQNKIPTFDVEPHLRKAQRFILILGPVLTAASVYMTWNFGLAWRGVDWAIVLSLFSLLACTLPIFMIMSYLRGWRMTGHVIATVWAALFMVDAATQVGFSAASRTAEKNDVKVQNAVYDGRKADVARHTRQHGIWLKQKEELLKLQPWAATVSADQLRESLKTLQDDLNLEEADGGCGPKCRKLIKDKKKLQLDIAAAEKLSTINKQLKATERLIATSSHAFNQTERRISYGDAQMAHLTKVTTGFNLEVSEEAQQTVEMILTTMIGIGVTLAAAFAFGIGLIDWRLIDRNREMAAAGLPSHISHPIAYEEGQTDGSPLPSFLQKKTSKDLQRDVERARGRPSVLKFDGFDKAYQALKSRT